MKSVLLITLSGVDRPGLVRELSDVVNGIGANWEQSRMMHLSGHFVGLLEVSVEETKAHELIVKLRELGDLELTIAEGSSTAPPEHVFHLELVGADHPGIVSEIFGVLAQDGINVELLRTETEAAADSGTPLFKANARLSAPAGADLTAIRQSLEAIAQDIMVTIDFAGA